MHIDYCMDLSSTIIVKSLNLGRMSILFFHIDELINDTMRPG